MNRASGMIRGVIFDIDGTLLDSVDAHARTWQQTFERFGLSFPYPEIRYQIGKGGDHLMETLLSAEQIARSGEQIKRIRSELFKRDFLGRVRTFPYAHELLATLHNRGFCVALATSGKRTEVDHYIRLLDAKDFVDAVTTADDVSSTKPDPDLLSTARDQLGGLPAPECIFIADTPHDGEAAKRDGTPCIGLLCGGFPEADLRNSGAVAVWRDPRDLLENWQTQIPDPPKASPECLRLSGKLKDPIR